MADRRAQRARARDEVGPGQRRVRRRHVRGVGDRRAGGGRRSRPGSWSPTRRGRASRGSTGPTGSRRRRPTAPAAPTFGCIAACRWLGPGSLRLGLSSMRNPLRHTPLQLLAGWLPAGLVSTDSIKEVVRRAVPGRWVEHPSYWAVACDYTSGRRVPFGRVDAPQAAVDRRGRRLVRDPRLLSSGAHRRPALRRRRHLLGLEPRPARRPRARPRDLPQPAVLARARERRRAERLAGPGRRGARTAAGSAPRPSACAPTGPRSR